MRFRGLALGLALLSFGRAAAGQALSEERSKGYYQLHGALAGAGFVGAGLIVVAGKGHGAGCDLGPFWPDDLVRPNFSESASQASDRLLVAGIVLPLGAQLSDGFDTSFRNATLIYAEAHSANLFLTTATKLLVRRPRPYTHSPDPRIQEFADGQGSEAYESFYSGHASAAYTSAMAGSILYAARTDDLTARHVMWALEFSIAALTAQLRVRAGRHYRTDVLVGTLLGAGVGFAVPALHRVGIEDVRPSEWLTAAAAAGSVVAASEIFDLCGVVGMCSGTRDVRIPVQPSSDTSTGSLESSDPPMGRAPLLTWTLAPFGGGAAGLEVIGRF